MTTGPETIAAAIRDGLHELAEAVRWHSAPKRPPIGLTINPPAVPQDPSGKTRKAPRSDEQAEVTSVDPEGNHTPQTPVERAAWVMLKAFNEEEWEIETWQDAAQALADAGLLATSITRPNVATVTAADMTVAAPSWLADAWDAGYYRGVRDEAGDIEPADNPWRST